MPTPYALVRDVNGFNGLGLPVSEDNFSAALTKDVATPFTIPASSSEWVAIFNYEPTRKVYVAVNATAELPAGASIEPTTSVLSPHILRVSKDDVLSLITGDTNVEVGIRLFALR